MDFASVCGDPSPRRNPQHFWGCLSQEERQRWLNRLQSLYHQIILLYFRDDPHLPERIAEFTHLAYLINLPVSEILGIHVQFMDELTKQLKLEGRSEELVLDYRLTLIDVIAHLCERYRRALTEIPPAGETP
ncbi:MAG: circadian clock protein KaiA [Gloeomargarita sp. SKYB31]|nr:circadian clock protein KaiA [Gloeomargarita sp. SKYB31]